MKEAAIKSYISINNLAAGILSKFDIWVLAIPWEQVLKIFVFTAKEKWEKDAEPMFNVFSR